MKIGDANRLLRDEQAKGHCEEVEAGMRQEGPCLLAFLVGGEEYIIQFENGDALKHARRCIDETGADFVVDDSGDMTILYGRGTDTRCHAIRRRAGGW
jgi:hypothetical protein